MTKICWRTVYYPLGKWVDEGGREVETPAAFRCRYGGRVLICVMVPKVSPPGHGEPSVEGNVPHFVDDETLAVVKLVGAYGAMVEFVELIPTPTEEDGAEVTYKVVRFFRDTSKAREVIHTGLTLAEAQEHCADPTTIDPHGAWFDGYNKE